jgi:hypothetical protein
MAADPSVNRVSTAELRLLFETGHFAERITSGELIEILESEGRPSPRSGEPYGTRSQIIAYMTREGRIVLRLHRYLRPDGTLGASGKPDPKYIFHDNVIYKQARPAHA